ncbi:MAG: diguanylate cyclase [Amycolatopsis sp.]|jgi:diguanylate cyclase (GGDEF)-like protein|nr:diguanylate cyclase [Amycolatopsis sp.]
MSMDGVDTADRGMGRIRDALSPRRWNLAEQRRRFIVYCLLIESVAVAGTVTAAITVPTRTRDIVVFLALAGLGVLQAELGRQVERVRRLVSDTPHINLTSVWTFAGVLLLPPALVTALIVILYLHLATRSLYRIKKVPPFRVVFNASLVIVTCHATQFVMARTGIPTLYAALGDVWPGVGVIVLAAAVYFLVGAVTVLPGLKITTRSFAALFGGWGDNVLEVSTLCLGVLTALALGTLPALVVVVLPPLLLLHRVVLVKQLEDAVVTDEKTGLFNTTGWHKLATRELARAQRRPKASFGVLMVDLDLFKRINDTYGHLAGDAVLRAVAGAIRGEVRDYDSVGRFGGEEFLVLLPDVPERGARAVAERVRAAITRLEVSVDVSGQPDVITGLSASIGVATYPHAGTALDRILDAADSAMYQAKAAGRNRVVSVTDA